MSLSLFINVVGACSCGLHVCPALAACGWAPVGTIGDGGVPGHHTAGTGQGKNKKQKKTLFSTVTTCIHLKPYLCPFHVCVSCFVWCVGSCGGCVVGVGWGLGGPFSSTGPSGGNGIPIPRSHTIATHTPHTGDCTWGLVEGLAEKGVSGVMTPPG